MSGHILRPHQRVTGENSIRVVALMKAEEYAETRQVFN